jgi:hypothetical protein
MGDKLPGESWYIQCKYHGLLNLEPKTGLQLHFLSDIL